MWGCVCQLVSPAEATWPISMVKFIPMCGSESVNGATVSAVTSSVLSSDDVICLLSENPIHEICGKFDSGGGTVVNVRRIDSAVL